MELEKPPAEAREQILEQPYDYATYLYRKGDGSNLLRTERVVQPRVLRPGDILANGDQVLALPRVGNNSSVWVLLSGGLHGHWIELPPRIPLALLTPEESVVIP